MFFEALSRLGLDDARGIAARIGTKGEMEVRQYLKLLQDAVAKRAENDELHPIRMADFPAAVELSADCCRALDEAADAIALRQEKHEDSRERQKWHASWVVSQPNYREMEADAAEMHLSSVRFFKVENWLNLPMRVFMNAPTEEGNWRSVGELPSIRTTALEDFYSLAVSVTRRLVSAAVYVSMSRIRSKKAVMPWTRNLVRKRDVDAAVASLHLRGNKRAFWVGCPRRLQLEIWDGDGQECDPMTYEDVERSLSLSAGLEYSEPLPGPVRSESPSSESSPDTGHPIKDKTTDSEGETDPGSDSDSDSDSEAQGEADEVIQYSAIGFPETTRARQALISRVKAEVAEEEYADSLDRQASFDEERRMWAMLGRDPPSTLAKGEAMARPVYRGSVGDVVPSGRDWRDKLRFVAEWEVAPRVRGPKCVEEKAAPARERLFKTRDTPEKPVWPRGEECKEEGGPWPQR